MAQFYKISPEEILIAHDELDIPPGTARFKRGGGHGGHNGLRDIDARIGKDYHRIRIGVGHPGDKDQVSGYVLGKFAKAETADVEQILTGIAKESALLTKGENDLFMTRLS